MPLQQPTATTAGRIDASARPIVAQYSTIAPSETASAINATCPAAVGSADGRKANATAINAAASPALKRKNFTPASRETTTSVKMMPRPRCVRKRNRIKASTESLVDLVPVHHIPPGADVVGAPVLILEVVRVLPDVDPEHGLLSFHQRAVLIGRAFNHQLPTLIDDPRPSAAKAAGAGLCELLLERVEPAERRCDGVGDGASRLTAGVGAHDLPEHAVVGMTTAVIADGRANVLGNRVDPTDQVLNQLLYR